MMKSLSHMSHNFKLLEPVVAVHEAEVVTEDNRYWDSYQFPVTVKEFGVVTHIDIQPVFPYNIAASSSTRIQIYSGQTSDRLKTFSRFHDTVYGASYRSDGKLLVAGNEDCHARVFDTDGRVPLRIFKGHTGPVHVTQFCNSMTQIFTASDDKTLRVWDVSTEQMTCKFSDHEDYIRSGALSKSSSDIIATGDVYPYPQYPSFAITGKFFRAGSYDHTVKLYDTRTQASVLSVDHGQPVEAILIYPSGSILLSAGGNTIKAWDILQGGKLLATFCHHHKTITCMAFNHDYSRLLSGSLDRHVKIYDVASYSVVHNMDFPAAILSMAVSEDDKVLAVGMADKMLSIRQRKQDEKIDTPKPQPSARTDRKSFYMRGKDYMQNSDEIIIHKVQLAHLPAYERFFKKFQFSQALDASLERSVPPEVTIAVIQELIRRSRLHTALAGRTGKSLTELLHFMLRNITKISYSSVLLDVLDILADIYTSELSELAEPVRIQFLQLQVVVKNEAELHRQMYALMGCMDAVLASNTRTERRAKPGSVELGSK